MSSRNTNLISFFTLFILFTIDATSQIVSGVVIDDASNPINNALVINLDQPSVWTKTDEQGAYSLDATINDQLSIAALHFETKKIMISQTSNFSTTLEKDPLLVSDVYHISFDHLRPGDYYSKEEMKKDFPVPSSKGFYEKNDESTNRVYVDNNISVDNDGQSIKVKFPAGQLKTANSGLDARIPLANTYKNNDFDGEELYLSYWIKFSDNFEFDKCGGKLPSLGGSDLAVRENEWKGRIMWRNGGSIQFYMELPHKADKFEHDSLRFWGDKVYDGGDICTNEFTSYLSEPGWHNIELHYKLDNGTPTGVFEGWVDGDKGHKIINSEAFGFYRRQGEGLENLTTNAILLSAFLGGSSSDYEPDEDIYIWLDEFRVSRTRVNEYETYADKITSIDKEEKVYLDAYPNPSSDGIFHINESGTWKVTNFMGQQVSSGNGKIVQLQNLSSGIYFIHTNTRTQQLIIK